MCDLGVVTRLAATFHRPDLRFSIVAADCFLPGLPDPLKIARVPSSSRAQRSTRLIASRLAASALPMPGSAPSTPSNALHHG